MILKHRTNGFVFKKTDISEADQIFSVITEDFGRLEITAKGIRKITSKLRANIDIFYLSEIEFIQGKSNNTLIDAIKIKKFNFRELREFELARRVEYVLDNFIKGQEKDKKTFDLLVDFFNNLGLSKIRDHQLIFHYFFWNFLSFQGYYLQAENCAICKGKMSPYNIYFSAKDGGVICKRCINSFDKTKKINSDIVKILRLVLSRDWQTVLRLKVGASSQELLNDIYDNAIYTFSPEYC